MAHQTIIVLDFGSQYTQLIARRLRELSIYSEVWPPDTPIEKIRARQPAGVILSGGPKSVSESGAPRCDPGVYAIGRPVLGICYGMQLMADALGGRVAPAPSREFGHATVTITGRPGPGLHDPAALFTDVPDELRVWASHGDFVAAAPAGFSVVATSANAPIAAMADPQRSLYAILFHPEVVHTERGLEILRNFAFNICGCTGDWTMASFVEEATAKNRADVGQGRAGVSRTRVSRSRSYGCFFLLGFCGSSTPFSSNHGRSARRTCSLGKMPSRACSALIASTRS